MLLAGWAALAAGLAWTQEPVWWLTAAAITGFVSLWAATYEFEDEQDGGCVWVFSGITAFVVYILTAVSFTSSGLAVG